MFSVASSWIQKIAIGLISTVISCTASASDDTLVRVLQTGRIVLGAHDGSAPLSYLDASGKHIGYHMDVCLRLVKAIQQHLEMAELRVVTVPTNVATRFALLNNHTVDIECAHNPIKASTLSQALYSHATMISEVRFMTTTDHADLDIDHLGGRVIGVVTGDSSVGALRTLTRRRGMRVSESYGRAVTDLFSQLSSGRVEAVALPLPYLMAQRALSADPSHYQVINGLLLSEPLALMFRVNDERLHALANETLSDMMRSGEMARLYEKWFLKPIPGFSQAVGLPLSPQLKAWFNDPGSEMKDL